MIRDEPKPAASLKELSLIELVLKVIDVSNEQSLIFLSPAVINLDAFVLIQHQ